MRCVGGMFPLFLLVILALGEAESNIYEDARKDTGDCRHRCVQLYSQPRLVEPEILTKTSADKVRNVAVFYRKIT